MMRLGRLIATVLVGLCALHPRVDAQPTIVFPGEVWEERSPLECGVDGAKLDELAERLGGRGCVIKDGYVVKTWGDQAEIGDWFSSAKPVLSTMLFFAIQEGLVDSVDQRISDFGWELREQDRTMTFRHLADMTSGYARPEAPGEAWAYNDFAIQLYQKALFATVFKAHGNEAAAAPHRLGALGFQDGLKFNSKNRLRASVRDWARIVWFWMNRGQWEDRQILDRRFFDEYMKPDVPEDLPRTQKADEDDYLGIGSYGGRSDQTYYGPGVYGFNWWFNDTSRNNPDSLMWPDAPPDTVMSLGARGNCSAMFSEPRPRGDMRVWRLGRRRARKPNGATEPGAQTRGGMPAATTVTRRASPANSRNGVPSPSIFEAPWPRRRAQTQIPSSITDCRFGSRLLPARRTMCPGFFAGDGTGGLSGDVWRVMFPPDETGEWTFRASFREGENVAVQPGFRHRRPRRLRWNQGTFRDSVAGETGPRVLSLGQTRVRGRALPEVSRRSLLAEGRHG